MWMGLLVVMVVMNPRMIITLQFLSASLGFSLFTIIHRADLNKL